MKIYILFTFLLFSILKSYSCTCSFIGSLENDVKSSDLIIKGKIVEKERIVFPRDSIYGREYGYVYTIKVKKAYRDQQNKYIKVVTGYGGPDCGYRFKKGRSYLIFGYASEKAENTFATSVCTATQKHNKKTEKIIVDYFKKK